MKTYIQEYDSYLNNKTSLLNEEAIEEDISAENITDGIFGAFSSTAGIEFKTDKASGESSLQSRNFVSGSAGWRIDSAGNLEASSGTFRGSLSGNTITIGTNAWHVDSSGNMWWGSAASYAAASNRISGAGVLDFGTGDISNLTAASYQSSASGTRVYTSGDNLYLDDTNAATILQAVTSTFSNGILYIAPATNDVMGIKVNTSLTTATEPSVVITNDGVSEGLTISTTRSTNADYTVKIAQSGTGGALYVNGGKVVVSDEVEISHSSVCLDINSSYAGGPITIDESATSGTTSSIILTSARPGGGLTLDLNHTSNLQKAINILYAGTGVSGDGIIDIDAENASFDGACIGLNAAQGAHINFKGDTSNNANAVDGDLWFNGTDLYLKVGATTYTLDKTAV